MHISENDPNERFETCLSPSVLIAKTVYCNKVLFWYILKL